MSESNAWFRRDGDTWVLALYLQPGARKTESMGLHDGCLKLKLAAPPVEGKANLALIAFLADWFAVPKNRISIKSGELSRRKVVVVRDSDKDPSLLAAV